MIEFVCTQIGASTYITPSGSFNDRGSIKAMKEKVSELVSNRSFNLVLDISAIHTINSEALEALLDIQSDLTNYGGGLKIVNVKPLLKEIFTITGFQEYVDIV